MTTEVQCTICGRLIESNTVTKKTYSKGDIIDYGCPYDGAKAPLRATSGSKKTKVEPPKVETATEEECCESSTEEDCCES